jgi:hypothetical protein
MQKLIRELRMGMPKMFKTGAVVGTYPKPLLYFGFDRGGLEIIPPKSYTVGPNDCPFDCCFEDIIFEKPGTMSKALLKTEQPKITAFDYTTEMPMELTLDYAPQKAQAAAISFQGASGDFNVLNQHIRANKPFPFKTIVFDSMTGYAEIMKMHLSSFNPNAMTDARQWAYMVGEKTRQLCIAATGFPCHTVFLFHTSSPEKNEETSQVQELPSAYGKGFRDVVGGLFSQYFYATKVGGKPVIKNADYMMVKGLGSRWPAGLAAESKPDFKSIYGKEITI